MKKIIISAFAVAGAITLASCEKNLTEPVESPSAQLTVRVSGTPQTKATGAISEDGISNYYVYVFNGNTLDGYSGGSASTLQQSLRVTAGDRDVYVLVNAPAGFSATSITNKEQFDNYVVSLENENSSAFSMVGRSNCTVVADQDNDVTVDVSRLVAKVVLNRLAVNFTDTPLEGKTLENISVYIKNVPSAKTLALADAQTTEMLSGRLWNDGALAGILMDSNIGTISQNAAHTTVHSFYGYQNGSESALPANATRLVIKGDLDADGDGTAETYYWSFAVNKSNATSGHYGVLGNHQYSASVVIKRAGIPEDDPNADDKDLEYADMDVSVNVQDWTEVELSDVEF